MELSEWRGLFLPRILERGGNYYRQRRVVSLFRQGDQIQAAVQGQELYRVTIDLWNDQLEYWECSCPFAAQGEPCKHLAAVFYAVEHSPFTKEPEEKEKEDGPLLEAVVKALPEERAKALLLLLAQRSKKNEELIRLQGEVPKNKQQEWKRKIDPGNTG